MNRDQFIRALRRYCRANGLEAPRFVARHGKGGHGRIFVGEVFTSIPSGELKTPTRENILRQLRLPKGAI